MKNKTAVEWLIEQTRTPEWHSLKRGDILEQAKELEKEQKEKTWIEAMDYSIMYLKDKTSKTSKEAFDEYYNLTYGGENNEQ